MLYIYLHCHPLLSYGPNFKYLAHWEVSLNSITNFHLDIYIRKAFSKNMGKKIRFVYIHSIQKTQQEDILNLQLDGNVWTRYYLGYANYSLRFEY